MDLSVARLLLLLHYSKLMEKTHGRWKKKVQAPSVIYSETLATDPVFPSPSEIRG